MALKLLNPKTLISSLETIKLKVYAHDGTFNPSIGLTTVGYRVYDSDGLITYGLFTEVVSIPGIYEADVELPLTDPLPAGQYYVLIHESGIPNVISLESIISQFGGLDSEVATNYKPIVKITGAIANLPSDITLVVTVGTAGVGPGAPMAATVAGNLGAITFDDMSLLITETEIFSASLDGDPTGFLAAEVTVAFPAMIKPDGTAIANVDTDITATFGLGSGAFVVADQLDNAAITGTGVTFALADVVIQDSYSFIYAAGTTETVPGTSASFLTNGSGVLATIGADVLVINNTDSLSALADTVNGTSRVVDFTTAITSATIDPGDSITLQFYRLPDTTISDSLTIDYSRLPNSTYGDDLTVTYRIPATIDLVSFEKGADLAAAEILLEQNQRREFHIATQHNLTRKVAAGTAEAFTIKTKNFSDTNFDNPVTEKKILLTYKELSQQSDIVLAEPEE